jgi:mycothiol synthase
MLIRHFNEKKDKTRVIEVWNKVLKDINPVWEITEEELDIQLKLHGDQTNLLRDCLIVEDNEKNLIGFALIYKSSKKDSWWCQFTVLPHFFKTNLLVTLFEAILNIAKKQNAPKLRFAISNHILTDSPLQIKFEEIGLKPVQYDFWMRMDVTGPINTPNTPHGIKFQKQKELNDYTNYVKILNDAFNGAFDYTPYTEQEFKSVHTVGWNGYDVQYWFAIDGNNPVGICFVTINPESHQVGLIYTLAVLHKYHHRGIGSSLLGFGIQSLIEKGCKTIELDVEANNENALTLYKKYGFYEIKSRTTIFYEI